MNKTLKELTSPDLNECIITKESSGVFIEFVWEPDREENFATVELVEQDLVEIMNELGYSVTKR